MAKNSVTRHPKQQTPAMSPSHAHTVGAASGANWTPTLPSADEEDDICPICDGDCTCNKRVSVTTTNNGSVRTAPISSAPYPPPQSTVPQQQTLKIKLTIPPTMFTKKHIASSGNHIKRGGTMSDPGNDVETASLASSQLLSETPDLYQPSKKRGRPPKAGVATRKTALAGAIDPQLGSGNEANMLLQSPQSQNRRATLPQAKLRSRTSTSFKVKGTTVKKTPSSSTATTPLRRRVLLSDYELFSDDDHDDKSEQFPTFVSACSTTSDNDESDTVSLSEFESDSSIEAEEESFILSEEKRAHDKARVRRELMGNEGQRKRAPHNNWVIRPRKQSVSPSNNDMDVDSDDATDEEEEGPEEEEAGDAEEDETDAKGPSVGYVGVATGWSEDDESSFDADLFFANLSGSDSDGSSSSGEENDVTSELDAASFVETALVRPDMTDLPLEVTESWDGQIVFTTGLQDGHGILDHDFELNTVQAPLEATFVSPQDSDVEMQTSDGADGEDEDGDCDLDESDGETTEEELVGPNGLPTDRAMMLFRLPTSVSAINPLSTMSPNASPRPRKRRSLTYGKLDSPTPADILSGKVYWDDSDEHEGSTYETRRSASLRGGVPIMGHFEAEQCNPQRSAIITGSNKDVPSPFPRIKRDVRRSRSRSQFGSVSGPNFSCPSFTRMSSVPLLTSARSSSQVQSPDGLLTTMHELPPAEAINLDDVLDSSFLDSDRDGAHELSCTSSENDAHKHLRSLSRWDLISVGAFRQTRESAGNMSDNPSGSWTGDGSEVLGGMMKTNPLSTILWHGKGSSTPKTRKRDFNVVISPVLLPIRDGDRTPTNTGHTPQSNTGSNKSHKTRKETRREKQMKRKSTGPAHQPYQHHNHKHHNQYHHHSHHPNMKTRSSSSVQRTNFFGPTSSVPPLSL